MWTPLTLIGRSTHTPHLHKEKALLALGTTPQELGSSLPRQGGTMGKILLSDSSSIHDSVILDLSIVQRGCLFKGDTLTVFLQIPYDGQLVICHLGICILTDHHATPQTKALYQEELFPRSPTKPILKPYLESPEVIQRTLLKTLGSILQKGISINEHQKFLKVVLRERRI
jgi:hypothetical protein